MFEPKLSRRLFLIFVAIPIAVVANAFRIVGAGVLGSYWRGAAEGFVHLFSGVVIFIGCSHSTQLCVGSANLPRSGPHEL
ncbi:MAG: archaeosortase/exosortase family protein [Candidatus Acidiferrales bacterium]